MPDIKLTDTQRVILSAASARDSGLILPLPKSVTTNRAAISKVLQSLVSKALVTKRPTKLDEDAWELDGARVALEVTRAGLAAIGIEPTQAQEGSKPSRPPALTTPQRAARKRKETNKPTKTAVAQPPNPSSKLGLVVAALSSRKGATIDDLIEATGWQAHSIRGAISGAIKKKMGLAVSSNAVEGRGRVYKIEAAAK